MHTSGVANLTRERRVRERHFKYVKSDLLPNYKGQGMGDESCLPPYLVSSMHADLCMAFELRQHLSNPMHQPPCCATKRHSSPAPAPQSQTHTYSYMRSSFPFLLASCFYLSNSSLILKQKNVQADMRGNLPPACPKLISGEHLHMFVSKI